MRMEYKIIICYSNQTNLLVKCRRTHWLMRWCVIACFSSHSSQQTVFFHFKIPKTINQTHISSIQNRLPADKCVVLKFMYDIRIELSSSTFYSILNYNLCRFVFSWFFWKYFIYSFAIWILRAAYFFLLLSVEVSVSLILEYVRYILYNFRWFFFSLSSLFFNFQFILNQKWHITRIWQHVITFLGVYKIAGGGFTCSFLFQIIVSILLIWWLIFNCFFLSFRSSIIRQTHLCVIYSWDMRYRNL